MPVPNRTRELWVNVLIMLEYCLVLLFWNMNSTANLFWTGWVQFAWVAVHASAIAISGMIKLLTNESGAILKLITSLIVAGVGLPLAFFNFLWNTH